MGGAQPVPTVLTQGEGTCGGLGGTSSAGIGVAVGVSAVAATGDGLAAPLVEAAGEALSAVAGGSGAAALGLQPGTAGSGSLGDHRALGTALAEGLARAASPVGSSSQGCVLCAGAALQEGRGTGLTAALAIRGASGATAGTGDSRSVGEAIGVVAFGAARAEGGGLLYVGGTQVALGAALPPGVGGASALSHLSVFAQAGASGLGEAAAGGTTLQGGSASAPGAGGHAAAGVRPIEITAHIERRTARVSTLARQVEVRASAARTVQEVVHAHPGQ